MLAPTWHKVKHRRSRALGPPTTPYAFTMRSWTASIVLEFGLLADSSLPQTPRYLSFRSPFRSFNQLSTTTSALSRIATQIELLAPTLAI